MSICSGPWTWKKKKKKSVGLSNFSLVAQHYITAVTHKPVISYFNTVCTMYCTVWQIFSAWPYNVHTVTDLKTHYLVKVKVKGYRNRPGVAHRVPGGLGYQMSMTFSTWRWWGCQPHAPASFIPRKCSWYSFSLGAELTPGPWYSQKEYITEKSSDTTGNRSRDRPTSSAAP